mmetsp:Transcript_111693/g.296871  ORF Transcript_111693/g.296871 Transcript_111693/m.296871 type:complete len:90 (-) Transcript_111693:104-373(-)
MALRILAFSLLISAVGVADAVRRNAAEVDLGECDLPTALGEQAWGPTGLCHKVYETKEWSMEDAAKSLKINSGGKMECSKEDIEKFCGK